MKEELKQAIEEQFMYIVEVDAVEKALQYPSILRHCDPEIMKKAGWVREEEEILNNNKAILIDSFIEHCKELNIKIPDYAFESFFNA